MLRRILPLLLALLASPLAAAADEGPFVPTPRASALPISATNRPFLSAARTLQPVDLAAADYVEEEVLVSGVSSTYAWANAAREGVVARATGLPWTTRLIVRRPRDPAKFSGRVVLELLDANGPYDVAPLWGLSWAHFLRRGDAWAGLTVHSTAVQSLQKFDPVRYATVDYKPGSSCGERGAALAGDAVAWDLIAQSGALLRSASRENPLATLHPQRIVVAGFGQGGGYVATFVNALHAQARRVGGAPVFDAYLSAASIAPVPLEPCTASAEARRNLAAHDVPFIAVATQSDFGRSAVPRRADSDVRGEMFRLYEIAGASRSGPYPAGLPAPSDLEIGGLAPQPSACRELPSDFPMGYAFNAIWQQLDDYLVKREPLGSQPRLATGPGGLPQLDERGNARGGFRLPQVDAPLAVYSGRSTTGQQDDAQARARCEITGSMRSYDQARLRQLYRDREGYVKQFDAAVDAAVQERRLVPEDAAALKDPKVRVLPAF